MANIFRGPLFTGRREVAPVHQPLSWFAQGLLTTLLAVTVVPIPPGAQACNSAQQYRHNVSNTSAGAPRVLSGKPTALNVHQAPARSLWQPDNTSKSTPIQQYPSAVIPPTVVAPHFAPQYRHNVVNTALGVPSVLSGLPTALYVHQAPARPLWQPPDTSRSTPIQQYPAPVVVPFIVQPHYAPQRALWKPSDTSASLPKTLYFDAVAPIFNAPYSATNWRSNWQPSDSSQGTPEVLLPVIAQPLPIGQASWVGLQKSRWQPSDTSQSSYVISYTVIAAPMPPGKFVFVPPQRYVWQVVNTSQSSLYLVSSAIGERSYTFAGFTFISG